MNHAFIFVPALIMQHILRAFFEKPMREECGFRSV